MDWMAEMMTDNSSPRVDFEWKVAPKRTAVLVVDVQNDFCSPDGYMDREGHELRMVKEMLPRLRSFLGGAEQAGVPAIYFQANYASSGNWYLSPVWLDRAARVNRAGGHIESPVCSEGDWGFDLVDGIAPRDPQRDLILKKHRYSGFVNTELDLVLRSKQIQTVVVTGVATNVCVESTARDAFMRDYFVVMAEDCCATYSDEEQLSTVRNIQKYFGIVTDSTTVLSSWSGAIESKTPIDS